MTKEKITRSELKEKRTANRKVFENQDHSRTVEIYMEPVHYEDEDGNWKEMDDTLEEVAFGRSIGGTGNRKFCNNKGKLAIQLMDSAEPAATASLTMDTCALRWGMEGAAASVKAEKTEAIRLKSENLEENICRITFLPNQMWLKAQERIYPVVIDPVTTTSKKASEIYDAHVDSLYEEDNFQKSIILKTMGGDEVQRSFIRFELPEMKTGDMVVSARLVLVSLAEDNKERTVEVHKVLHAWNSNSINWYNKPLYSETIEDLCCYKGDKQKYITMDITRMVKDWYQNGGNYGLMLKDDYELSGYTEFLSSDCDNGYQDMRPRIDISYVNYSGLEDYWTYHSQDAGRAGTVHVNDYNGNLIMIHDTMNTEGSLEPMALSHVYNSNNCAVNLGYGYGFALNYHQTLVKTKIGGTDYYKHTDGDGTIHYFYYDSTEKKWKDESGLEQTLTIHTDGTEQLVIHDKEDNQLRFRNGWLVKVQDKNGNCLSISWAEQRIISITDGSGRKTTLDYLLDNNGKRTTLTQITGPSGNKKTFTYGSGNLTGITDIDGEKVKYVYNGNHMLTEVHNIDG